MFSTKVRCLLSNGHVLADLHGYGDFDAMQQQRLHKKAVHVLVSAWGHGDQTARPVATIEHMTKVGDPAALADAVAQAWTMVLRPSSFRERYEACSPRWEEYWGRPV